VGDVIVVSEALPNFFYFMTVALYGDRFDIDYLDRVQSALIGLRIINGSEALDFDIDSRGDLPDIIDRYIKIRVSYQMEFVFGHEFAHYSLDHLAIPVDYCNGVETATTKAFSVECELKADLVAVTAVEKSREDKFKIAIGAYDVMLFLHLAESIGNVGGMRKLLLSETHPAAIDRLSALVSKLSKIFPPQWRDISASIAAVDQLREDIVEVVTKGSRRDLLTFYGSLYLSNYKMKIGIDRIDF
jgi:hypothetical protein